MWQEFKTFVMRGNVMDLAVGIIIGAAFTAIVNSLVNDVLMPPIGWLVGGIDFSEIVITLPVQGEDGTAVTIGIGLFINALINFVIVAIAVFFLVRGVNRLMVSGKKEEKAEEAPAGPSETELMIAELKAIREALERSNR